MGEQGIVGEVPQSAGVVGHAVQRTGEIMMARMVAMRTLEERVKTEEVGPGCRGAGRPFSRPGEGSPVIPMDPECTLVHMASVSEDGLVGHGGSQFQVRDGHGAMTMLRGDQGGADSVGKGCAPHEGR